MTPRFVRAFRTPSSERFIVQLEPTEDSAVLELHYLPSGRVAGTLMVFEHSKITDAMIADLLRTIDEVLLPEVSIQHHDISFTVFRGHVIGSYAPTKLD